MATSRTAIYTEAGSMAWAKGLIMPCNSSSNMWA